MTMETIGKVFKPELVVMSLQPAASPTEEVTPKESDTQEEGDSRKLHLQLKSPTKTTTSYTENSSVENDLINVDGPSSNSGQNSNVKLENAVENVLSGKTAETAPQVKVNLISKTSITSSRDLSASTSLRHQSEQLESDFPSKTKSTATISFKNVSKSFDSGKEGNGKAPKKAGLEGIENVETVIKHGVTQSISEEGALDGNQSILPSDAKLVLPAGIQDLLDGGLESDGSSEYSESDSEDHENGEIECFILGDKLELPLGIQELIEVDFKDKSQNEIASEKRESRRSVSDLKDIFVEKIEEASGRRSSVGSEITDVTSSSDGIRSRSESVSSGKVTIPEGIKELISSGSSVRNKVSVFEVKANEQEMEQTKLSPRNKIDVDFVGKKFKQIQKTMKNISDVKEKAVQKPIVPAVRVNSKINAFEKSVKDGKVEPKVKSMNATRQVKGGKTKQRVEKDEKEIISTNKQKNVNSKELLKQPPLAQSLFNKVIMETPKLTNDGMHILKGTQVPKNGDTMKEGASKPREVPLVQKLLFDVVKDIRQDVQKQEENAKLIQKSTEEIKPKRKSGQHEQNSGVFRQSKPAQVSDVAESDVNISPLNENFMEKTSKLGPAIYKEPQKSDNKEGLRTSTSDGTNMSNGGVRGDSEKTGPSDRKQQSRTGDALLLVASADEGDEIATKQVARAKGSEITLENNSDKLHLMVEPKHTEGEIFNDVSADQQKKIHSLEEKEVRHPSRISMKVSESLQRINSPENAKVEISKTPDSPSKAKVATLTNTLTSGFKDGVVKKEEKVIDSKVSKLASAINTDPGSLLSKKLPKSPSKVSNTGSQSSVFNIIKKIQKANSNEIDTTAPKGKVKISPKFSVEAKEDIVFNFKTSEAKAASGDMKGSNASRSSGPSTKLNLKKIAKVKDDEPDERDMRDEGFRDEVAEKLKTLSEGDEDGNAELLEKGGETNELPQSVIKTEKPTITGQDQNVKQDTTKTNEDTNDNYTNDTTKQNDISRAKEFDADEKNRKQESVGPGFVFSKKGSENQSKKSESLITKLKNKLNGKIMDQTKPNKITERSTKQNVKPAKLGSIVSVQETKDETVQDSNLEEPVIWNTKATECDRIDEESAAALHARIIKHEKPNENIKAENNLEADQIGTMQTTGDSVDEKIKERSDSEMNTGVAESVTISVGMDEVIAEREYHILKSDLMKEVKEEENPDTVSSFTKHELFFTSAKDATDHGGEEEKAAKYLKPNMSGNTDLKELVDTDMPEQGNRNSSQMENKSKHISGKEVAKDVKEHIKESVPIDKNDNSMELSDHHSLEKVWNIIESSKPCKEVDMEEHNDPSFNNSLSTSTVSLESSLSLDFRPTDDLMKVDVSKLQKKSSGNKMSKPEFVQYYDHTKTLEHLEENKENFNSISPTQKTIDIRDFEALKVYFLYFHLVTEVQIIQSQNFAFSAKSKAAKGYPPSHIPYLCIGQRSEFINNTSEK